MSELRRGNSRYNYQSTHGDLGKGRGVMRSCGKCLKHKPQTSAGKQHKILGWCCNTCFPKDEK